MFHHWISWGLERRYWIYWITLITVGRFFKILHYISVLSGGRLFFRIYAKGQEHLRVPRGPLILMPNHESYIDHFIALAVIPWRSHVLPLRTVTATYLFESKSFAGTLIRAGLWFLGAYPAHNEGLGSLAEKLDAPLHILKDDHVVVIYSEGRFSEDIEGLHSFHPGVAYLAARTNALILPIAFRGAFRLTPHNNALASLREIIFGRRIITVHFGAPIRIVPPLSATHAISHLDGIENDLDVFLGNPLSGEYDNAILKTIYGKTHQARNKILKDMMDDLWEKLHQLYHSPVEHPGPQTIDYHTCRCQHS